MPPLSKNLYHYTNEKCITRILEDKCINVSSGRGGQAFYGDGVYFTDLRPRNTDDKLLEALYEGWSKANKKRLEWVLVISRSELESAGYEMECVAPHIWKVDQQAGDEINRIDLDDVQFSYHHREHR